MTLNVFTTGNTITLTAVYTYNGLPSDLDALPTVTIYEADETTIVGTAGTADHLEVGIYAYKVTLPGAIGSQVYYAEFSGKSGGKPIVGRYKITAEFAPV